MFLFLYISCLPQTRRLADLCVAVNANARSGYFEEHRQNLSCASVSA